MSTALTTNEPQEQSEPVKSVSCWARCIGETDWIHVGKHSNDLAAALLFAKRRKFSEPLTQIELKYEDGSNEPIIVQLCVLDLGGDYNVEMRNPDRVAIKAMRSVRWSRAQPAMRAVICSPGLGQERTG